MSWQCLLDVLAAPSAPAPHSAKRLGRLSGFYAAPPGRPILLAVAAAWIGGHLLGVGLGAQAVEKLPEPPRLRLVVEEPLATPEQPTRTHIAFRAARPAPSDSVRPREPSPAPGVCAPNDAGARNAAGPAGCSAPAVAAAGTDSDAPPHGLPGTDCRTAADLTPIVSGVRLLAPYRGPQPRPLVPQRIHPARSAALRQSPAPTAELAIRAVVAEEPAGASSGASGLRPVHWEQPVEPAASSRVRFAVSDGVSLRFITPGSGASSASPEVCPATYDAPAMHGEPATDDAPATDPADLPALRRGMLLRGPVSGR